MANLPELIPEAPEMSLSHGGGSDTEWLQQWSQLLDRVSFSVKVPQEASAITTPLVLTAWRHLLIAHPNRALTHFFLQGIAAGFRIGYNPPSESLKPSKRNMQSALRHPEVVDEYLAKEQQAGRVRGPFNQITIPEAHINHFGVIPKAHQPNKWRLIVDLSHPAGRSVNDAIPKHLCSMSYISVDDTTEKIITLGPGALLAKIDVQSAFRLILVHPADCHLLAMEWRGSIYIDTCLPFGLRSAPKLFNVLADLLEWILINQGVTFLLHYLDDYLTIGPPN